MDRNSQWVQSEVEAGIDPLVMQHLAQGLLPSEPSISNASPARTKNDGWLRSTISNLRSRRRELHVLDATRLDISSWMPGNWISGDEPRQPL